MRSWALVRVAELPPLARGTEAADGPVAELAGITPARAGNRRHRDIIGPA